MGRSLQQLLLALNEITIATLRYYEEGPKWAKLLWNISKKVREAFHQNVDFVTKQLESNMVDLPITTQEEWITPLRWLEYRFYNLKPETDLDSLGQLVIKLKKCIVAIMAHHTELFLTQPLELEVDKWVITSWWGEESSVIEYSESRMSDFMREISKLSKIYAKNQSNTELLWLLIKSLNSSMLEKLQFFKVSEELN
jgi:hypothetical protein